MYWKCLTTGSLGQGRISGCSIWWCLWYKFFQAAPTYHWQLFLLLCLNSMQVHWFPLWSGIHKFQRLGCGHLWGATFLYHTWLPLLLLSVHYCILSTTRLKRDTYPYFEDEGNVTQRDEFSRSNLGSKCQTEVWTDVIQFPRPFISHLPFVVSSIKDAINQFPGLVENFHGNSWVAVVVVEGDLFSELHGVV